MSPIARTPTVALEPGVFLAESNAILWYFAEGTPLIPSDRLERARMAVRGLQLHAVGLVLTGLAGRGIAADGGRVA